MIRLIILGLALYLAARIVQGLFKSSKGQVEVHGDSKKKRSIDLSQEDVEDVDFKESKK